MHHTERVALKDQKCNNIIKDSIRLNIIYAMTNSEMREFNLKRIFLLLQYTGVGLHVVSFVIGAGSSLMFLVIVAVFVLLLCRKKW